MQNHSSLNTTDLPAIKAQLASHHEQSKEQFLNGISAREIVGQRARFIDNLLIEIWHGVDLDQSEIALVAVGGYGRGELHPYSDIDIAILLVDEPSADNAAKLEKFVTILWDLGLEIGHSVRTLDESVTAAVADITIMTNLLESRLLAGPGKMLASVQTRLSAPNIWPSQQFYVAKLEEQLLRHGKVDDALQRLEPNIKECPGGLRDIQVIAWVANRHFRTAGRAALVEHDFLTQEECDTLERGETFLWRIRCALHFLTGRHEDRLLFDHQKSIAQMLNYTGEAPNAAVEDLMKDYYRTIRELSCLNEMLLGLFDEAFLNSSQPLPVVTINRRFQATNNALEVRHDGVFRQSPYAMLEIFLILQQHPEVTRIRAGTIRLLLKHRHLIDENLRADLRARSLFMEIIRQPRRIGHELQRMHRYGILSAYLEVFALVEGLMQFDLFHIFTVDEHSLFVVRYMRRFSFPQNDSDKIALVPHVIANIPKLEVLYIAGLFHDIAKGRGGDHSELGAEEAVHFCQNHGLSNFDKNLVAWLVRNHLLMSTIAQRKDIYDMSVIQAFGKEVGDQIYLDYLYLLTIADIRGTNPDLWNGWKESLFSELYTATRRYLADAGVTRGDDERIEETKAIARKIIQNDALDEQFVETLWQDLDKQYFLRHRAPEVAWHTRSIANSKKESLPFVTIKNFSHRSATALFVYAKDSSDLFARTTAALDKLRLDVQDARIVTSANGYTLDTFMVLDSNTAEPVTDPVRTSEIVAAVQKALIGDEIAAPTLTRAATRALKNFAMRPIIDFDYDNTHGYTVMGVNAVDRPGLLSIVGDVMRTYRIELHDARIATIGERAEDYFCITALDGDPFIEPAMQETLRVALSEALTA